MFLRPELVSQNSKRLLQLWCLSADQSGLNAAQARVSTYGRLATIKVLDDDKYNDDHFSLTKGMFRLARRVDKIGKMIGNN